MASSFSWWIYLWTVSLLGNISSDLKAYIIHHEPVNFDKALQECSPSFLTPFSTKQEASDILELISTSLSSSEQQFTFWVGLRKASNECVVPNLPLRGFKWTVDGSQQVAEDRWREEPQLTCTTIRCAALLGEFDGSSVKNWGLVPSTCKAEYPFICKQRDTDQRARPQPETKPGPGSGSGPGPGPEPASGPEAGAGAGPGHGLDSCHPPLIPGARFYSLDPGNPSRMKVECWSGVLLELSCYGSRLQLDGSAVDAATVCPQCRDGYKRNASGNCVDLDECSTSPCREHCMNTEGSYECICYDQHGNHHSEGSAACVKPPLPGVANPQGGDGDLNTTDRPRLQVNPSLTSPPQLPPDPTDNGHIGLTDSSSLSGVLIPVLIAVMVLVVLVVVVVAVVKCCLMRRSKKRAMKKAEKMAMKSKEAASKDSIETANEKEAT